MVLRSIRRLGPSTLQVLHSPFFWIIFSGYIFRLLIMPLTGQHDVMFMSWHTHFILTENNLNIYNLMYEKFGDVVLNRPAVWTPYPIGFYLTNALWLSFLNKVNLIQINGWDSIWGVAQPARYVFLFKLPYFFIDLGLGVTLARLFGLRSWALWTWSTIAIYTPFLMGQNDLYPTACMAWGLCAASVAVNKGETLSRKSWTPGPWSILSIILLGLGATYKFFPLILVPPLAFLLARRFVTRILLVTLGCLPVTLAVLPFLQTSVFINGVLLNHEGLKLFREISLFGMSVSPFLLGYMILCLFLFLSDHSFKTTSQPWLLGLGIFTWIFLWTPTPHYWWIWFIPMLVVAAAQNRLFYGLWLILHLVFTIMLLTLHRELFIGLPVHLSTEFGIPDLQTAIVVIWPQYQKIVQIGLTFVTAGILASWILILISIYGLWSHDKGEIVEKKSLQAIFLFIPVTVLFLALISNLIISANLLSFSESRKWQPQSFDSGDVVQLEMKPVRNMIQGVRIYLEQGSNPQGQVTACLVNSYAGDIEVCTSAPFRNIDNQNSLMILLPQDYSIQPGEKVILKLEFSSPVQGRIDPQPGNLMLNGKAIGSAIDASLLYSFDPKIAFQSLIIRNILGDGILVITWLAIVICLLAYSVWILRRLLCDSF